MDNLQVTAHMGCAIAVYDDYSPSLDALLEWLLLDSRGLTQPNPTQGQVEDSRELVFSQLPLGRGDLEGEWYWQASSPCYHYQTEITDRFRKRWDYHDRALNWGKRKAKIDTSQGAEKNYDLPLYLRLTDSIHWFCVGDKAGIEELLRDCKGVGKKRSQGHGQVLRWDVKAVEPDWHLWRDGQLMRPMPYHLLFSHSDILNGSNTRLMQWGWRPPARLAFNQALCVMPAVVQHVA